MGKKLFGKLGFTDLNLGWKLGIGFGLIILLLLVVAYTSITNFSGHCISSRDKEQDHPE